MQQPALPSDQIRVQQGVYLFSALGGGVLHGAAAADHQLQMLQGPQILQRVFARHDEDCALAGRDRAGNRTRKGVVLDGFRIATVEVEIFVAA